ncbi:MAG: hypothetical protein ACK56A_03790, partial [Bacteroidota bacterium]
MEPFISTPIEEELSKTGLRSFQTIYHIKRKSRIKKWMTGTLIALLIILFLPWTQNIRATGSVTTLQQDQRPQEVNSVI